MIGTEQPSRGGSVRSRAAIVVLVGLGYARCRASAAEMKGDAGPRGRAAYEGPGAYETSRPTPHAERSGAEPSGAEGTTLSGEGPSPTPT